MSENTETKLIVPEGKEVERAENFPALRQNNEIQLIKEQCQIFLKSGLLPSHVKNWQQAFTIAMFGRELGMQPMESFHELFVISGKVGQTAKRMKAAVHQRLPHAIFDVLESTPDIASVKVARSKSDEPQTMTITREEADKAGWTAKDNWKKQAATMLLWRVIAKACRVVFPDCIGSAKYTPDELGVDTDNEGLPTAVIPSEDDERSKLEAFNERMKRLGETSAAPSASIGVGVSETTKTTQREEP